MVDIGEVSDALERGLIDISLAKKALDITDNLLNIIYSGKFDVYKNYIYNI